MRQQCIMSINYYVQIHFFGVSCVSGWSPLHQTIAWEIHDSVSHDCGWRSIYWEQSQSKNPEQRLRFCTAEESRLNKSLELQMRKDLRRENEEEGRRLDPRGWEGGTWDSSDGKKSEMMQESSWWNGRSYWISVQYRTSVYTGQLYCLSSWPQSERGESPLLRR